ncbi:MAG: methyltransferase [Gammaproteobacteria bacterium]|jgi:predicted methyltransferase|nr:methyltransferase [Gammaproteobacteria bacterium]
MMIISVPVWPRRVLLSLSALLLSACVTSQTGADSDAIAAAIANPARPAADVARDAQRNPQAVLEFAGLAPGMAFLDMFAGGGYYTEIAYYAVGPTGSVTAYNNNLYQQIATNALAERFADGRLSGVTRLVSKNNATALPENAFDVAMFGLSYHDIYHLAGERGWDKIDRPALLAEVYAALKPGGRVVVMDHVAPADMPDKQAGALHRINPEAIKADFLAAGFTYDGASDVLRNPNDDYALIAMAPQVRGQTDRVVLRFVK